jgi:DNA polymerase elongation subunit (family B)
MSRSAKQAKQGSTIDLKLIKSNASYLKVKGAYVQQPTPGVYGLSNYEVIESVDASALYPTIEILFNIGYETLYGRIYDPGIIDNFINLLLKIENEYKSKIKSGSIQPEVIYNQALSSITNAVNQLLKNFTTKNSVANKKEFINTNLSLAKYFVEKILDYILYKGSLLDLFKPKEDDQYFILRSKIYPLLEMILWLSEKNKGYNQLILDYAYDPANFEKNYNKPGAKFYFFRNVNSTKINFEILSYSELITLFKKYLLNPFGTLFYKHKDKLAYTVVQNKEGLDRRRIVKNRMLCLEGILDQFDSVPTEVYVKTFIELSLAAQRQEQNIYKLSPEQLRLVYKYIDKKEDVINWRVSSLKDFEFNTLSKLSEDNPESNIQALNKFLVTRSQQLNNVQLGIKVTLNSGYGILGLLSFQYSNPLLANSITNGGKIVGIKTFQQIAINTIENHFKISNKSSDQI